MNLSEHFTLEEFTASESAVRKGIDNDPPAGMIEKLKFTARGMEHVRVVLGVPIIVTSGYRSPELNAEIGGSNNSQHTKGEACDFIAPRFGTPLLICRALEASDVRFDQLIYEGGWVHISFIDYLVPRREVLTWKRGKGYMLGLVE